MGYYGKLEDKLKAQALRKEGYSYKEILEEIHVSKDTISKWCRDIPLTSEQKNRLVKNKLLGQRKGSIIAAENKRSQRIKKIENIYMNARKEIEIVKKRDAFMLGIALYAAEGTKMDKYGAFSNADPNLIAFMTKWFTDYAKVPKEKLRGRIWIHEELSEASAKKYWSKITKIPLTQFIKTYKVKRKEDPKRVRKHINDYGVFTVSFSDAMIHRKIMGWIFGVFDDKI